MCLQFGTTNTLCPRHHNNFLPLVMTPLYCSLKTSMLLVWTNSENVEIYLFYIFINILVYPYLINITYSIKHKDLIFKRIHYTRFWFIF